MKQIYVNSSGLQPGGSKLLTCHGFINYVSTLNFQQHHCFAHVFIDFLPKLGTKVHQSLFIIVHQVFVMLFTQFHRNLSFCQLLIHVPAKSATFHCFRFQIGENQIPWDSLWTELLRSCCMISVFETLMSVAGGPRLGDACNCNVPTGLRPSRSCFCRRSPLFSAEIFD